MEIQFERGILYVRRVNGTGIDLFFTHDDVPPDYDKFSYDCVATTLPAGISKNLVGFRTEYCHDGETDPGGNVVAFGVASDEDIIYFLREKLERSSRSIAEWLYTIENFCDCLLEEEKLRIRTLSQSL